LLIVNQCADHKNELINRKLTLFPLDFPKIYDFNSADIPKKVSEMKD